MGCKPETLMKLNKVKKLALGMPIKEACAIVNMSVDSYYKTKKILMMRERYKHVTGIGEPVTVGGQNEKAD